MTFHPDLPPEGYPVGDNIYYINNSKDLDDQADGGTITITETTLWILTDFAILTPHNIVIDGGNLTVKALGSFMFIGYTGSVSPFVSGQGSITFERSGFSKSSGNTVTLFDLSFGFYTFNNASFFGWNDMGSLSRGRFLSRFTTFGGWSAGFKFRNINLASIIGNGTITNPPNAILFDVKSNDVNGVTLEILGTIGTLQDTSSWVRIDPAFRDNSRFTITNSTLANGRLFHDDGIDGTFTNVTDSSITSPVSVTSVTDSNGLARFNFTGETVYAGQLLEMTGFSVGQYNGSWIITNTDNTSWFEMEVIIFRADSSGTFTSDSVTLEDIGTALTEGDTVDVSSDNSSDYDGGSYVYNVQTDSFQINRPFVVGGVVTGSWSTRGLTQRNNKVFAAANANFGSSKYIACAFVNGNVTPCGLIVNDVFTDIVFGTAGNALTECSNTERFKMIDEIIGVFECTSNEPVNGTLIYSITATSMGVAREFRFTWYKSTDQGATWLPLTNPAEGAAEIAGSSRNIALEIPVEVEKGDWIKPQVTRTSGNSDITVTHFTVSTSA